MARLWNSLFEAARRRSHRVPIRGRKSFAVSHGLELISRRLGVESLERRLLLAVTSSFDPASGLLTVSSNAADSISIEISGGQVEVNNAAPGTGPLAVAAVQSLSISSGPGGGTIDLSQLASGALPNLTGGQVTGSGATTLIAPLNQANEWLISGSNQGSVDTIAFQGVQNLTGGNQTDDFSYSADSLVTGTINEPVGGNLSFSGAAVTLAGTVTTHGGSVSINDATVINSGGSVTLQGSIFTQGGDLNVFGDTITVNDQSGSVTLSTRELANVPGNPASDPSRGNSGNIAFAGINITLSTNTASQVFGNQTTNLYSQVEAGSQFTAGTVNLTASEIAGAGSGNGFNFPVLPKIDVSQSSITLNAAAITAGAVTVTVDASSLHATTNVNSSTPTIIQTGINFLENFSILGGVADSTSQAAINLGADSSIIASSFTAMATATFDAEAKPIAIKLGVAIAIANTNAAVSAAGHITTAGDTTPDAGAINTLSASANAGGNLAGAGAAVAIGVENSSSNSTVANTAQIRCGAPVTASAVSTLSTVILSTQAIRAEAPAAMTNAAITAAGNARQRVSAAIRPVSIHGSTVDAVFASDRSAFERTASAANGSQFAHPWEWLAASEVSSDSTDQKKKIEWTARAVDEVLAEYGM